jgi:outer membrane receptor for ferrienterochelin and colicin
VRLRKLGVVPAGMAAASLVTMIGSVARADARSEARGHFKIGMSAIADGRYDQGIRELQRAYQILPHPNVLFNIARAYAESGDVPDALTFYQRYLESSPSDAEAVKATIARLQTRLERERAEAAAAAGLPGQPPVPVAPPGPGVAPPLVPANGATPPQAPTSPSQPSSGPATGTAGTPPPAPGARPSTEPAAKTEDVFAETVVTASKGAQSPLDAASSTSIVTQQDIRLSGITKIPELLRRLAGVDVMEVTGADTEVSLRGFNQRLSSRVLVLIDGRSVFTDFVGATLWQLLPVGVEDIDRIEVVRGPGSALYGADAFNGVINIITKTPGEGGSGIVGGIGDHDLVHGSTWATGRQGDFAWRASAGYDSLPRWSREVPDGRQDLHLTSSDQSSSARTERLGFRGTDALGKGVTVGVDGGLVNGTDEILGIGPLNDIVFNSSQVTHLMATLDSDHFEARVFWNRTRATFGLNAAPIGQSLLPGSADENVIDGEVQYKGTFDLGRHVKDDLRIGVEYRYEEVDWTYLDRTRNENHESLFVHDELKLGAAVSLVGDYRLDYVPYLTELVSSPRGALLYHPSKTSTVRASVGTSFRTPTFLESYLSLPLQLPAAGASLLSQSIRSDDPKYRVQAEKNFSTELGYLVQGGDHFTFDTSVFYDKVSNLIELAANRPVTLGTEANAPYDPQTGTYPLFYGGFDNQCQTYDLYGAELGVRDNPVEGVDLYANYTLNAVHQDDSGCSALQKASIVQDSRTSTSKLNVGAQARTRLGFDGEVDFHYVSPQTWGEQVENVSSQRVEEQALHQGAYTLLNARVGYRFFHDRADVGVVGFNLVGDEHREHPFGQVLGRRVMGTFGYRF